MLPIINLQALKTIIEVAFYILICELLQLYIVTCGMHMKNGLTTATPVLCTLPYKLQLYVNQASLTKHTTSWKTLIFSMLQLCQAK